MALKFANKRGSWWKLEQMNCLQKRWIWIRCLRSPIWVIPIITANIINIISHADQHSLSEIWTNWAKRSAMWKQGCVVPWCASCRCFLGIPWRSASRQGAIQGAAWCGGDRASIASNDDYSIASIYLHLRNSRYRLCEKLGSGPVFLVILPTGIGIIYLFRKVIRKNNRQFRLHIEDMSSKVSEMVEMMPVTRAHGLQKIAVGKKYEKPYFA